MSGNIWALMANATIGSVSAASATSSSGGGTPAGSSAGGSASSPASGLGRDAFMKLLLAQMRNQDPLSPMDGQAFFEQLAQLSVLEQMWQLNDRLQAMTEQQQLLQGGALIGKTVDIITPEGGQVTGTVAGVRVREDKVYLNVGGNEVALDAVVAINQ